MQRHTDTEGKEHVKMKAEIRMMQPQAKKCLELPEARRGNKVPSSLGLGREPGSVNAFILDFQPPELRKNNFLLF